MRKVFAAALAVLLWSGCAHAASPDIHIEDVALFYRVFDAAGGHPAADRLQHGYIDKGSAGMRRFFSLRNTTAARIAQAIADHPKMYADARQGLAVLPAARTRIAAALAKLGDLYPGAKFPPVTIAVGRGKPVAIADETGVMVGLESLCAITYFDSNLEDRFVHVVAHEYTHVEQALASPALYNKQKPTVLEESLIEGAAEFMAELTSGSVSSAWFTGMMGDRAKATEAAFVADEDKTDLSKWLYNGTIDKSGDLGYWVGYRIVKSYYEHAADKHAAIRDIIEIKDAHAFLARSGWQPGITL
ncbi:MAG: lytic murein transglycosylase [Proteobacteria bacterium]|nr:lytic murein transglycosylase [Pseudomonadota bacterium]